MTENEKRRKETFPKPPKPPERTHGSSSSALFAQSGPVGLGSTQRETLTLGDIKSSGTYTPGYETSVPTPIQEIEPTLPEPVKEEQMSIQETLGRSVSSVRTSWSPTSWKPTIDREAYIHPGGVVAGNVTLSAKVFVSAGAVIRADNEEPIFIGEKSNIQECVVLKDLPTRKDGKLVNQRVVEVGGKEYSLYIGKRVSLAPQSQVHGPAYIADEVFIGMQSLVFWARIEKGVIIEPGCLVMNVTIPSGVFVPAGLKLTTQTAVRDLPALTSKYRFYGIGEETVKANLELMEGYRTSIR